MSNDKKFASELMDAYVSDNKQKVRAWTKEYIESSSEARKMLRKKFPDRSQVYDVVEQQEKGII